MEIVLPEQSLVVLVGASGSGKSSFANLHFGWSEVLSSDACRGRVCDDETNQDATRDAFDLLHFTAAKRLSWGKLTVIDATSVDAESRKPLLRLARAHHFRAVAIVLDMPEGLCHERNRNRPDRNFSARVVQSQVRMLHRSRKYLQREGFHDVYILRSPEEVDAITIRRQRMPADRRREHGPFDIIGDIHGCFDELWALLEKLGYTAQPRMALDGEPGYAVIAPEGRRALFLGDLVDRGPRIGDVLRLVMDMVSGGTALCLPGNHEAKLLKFLKGQEVQRSHGLSETIRQLQGESQTFLDRVREFIEGLISHFVLDDGRLVVAHAGMREDYQGRESGKVRAFALYGETTGELDQYGLPIRYNWALDYRGRAEVVYGHTPVPEAEWLNHTICIDTGCVFGGKLTALRYPENALVWVPAARTYYPSKRPLSQMDSQEAPTKNQYRS